MKRLSSRQVIVPGESAWELWRGESGSPAGSALSLVKRFEAGEEDGDANANGQVPAFLDEAGEAEYGIAAAEISTVPLWIQVPESETEAAIVMQLEGRGIRAPEAGGGWHDHRIARRDGGRRLAVISVLNGGNSALANGSRLPTSMRSSADFLPFRHDRVTLYRELGALVVAVTQGSEVVYETPLVSKEAGEDAGREIVQIVFQLKFDEVVTEVSGLDVWVKDAEIEKLSEGTGLEVAAIARSAPMLPKTPSTDLVTPDVAARREAKEASARVRKIALITGVVFSAVVFAAVGAHLFLAWKRDALLEEIAEVSPRAAAVTADKGRWEEIAPAADRERSVLEILNMLSRVPSVRGVTLTKFEMAPGAITVSGTASKPGLALKFGGEIAGGAFLPEYRWEFPAPMIATDNSATFELKGTRKGTDETES